MSYLLKYYVHQFINPVIYSEESRLGNLLQYYLEWDECLLFLFICLTVVSEQSVLLVRAVLIRSVAALV